MKKRTTGCILFFSFLFIFYQLSHAEASNVQKSIAEKIIRFHVIANSDSEQDQALKLEVKNAVVTYTSDLLKDSRSIDETRQILLEAKKDILQIAQQVIEQNGFTYTVSASLTKCYFPAKSYGEATFPPGEYEAFRIIIGKGEGKNWWCLMYPPLCFLDISYGILPEESKEMLHSSLDTSEYNAIMNHKTKVKFRFRYLKFLNGLFD